MNLTGLEKLESFEAIVARLRAEQDRRMASLPPVRFPDPVGEDRDERRVIVWDFANDGRTM